MGEGLGAYVGGSVGTTGMADGAASGVDVSGPDGAIVVGLVLGSAER